MKYAYKIEPVFNDQEQQDISSWWINFAGDDVSRLGAATKGVDELAMRCFKHMLWDIFISRKPVLLSPSQEGYPKSLDVSPDDQIRILISNWFARDYLPNALDTEAQKDNTRDGLIYELLNPFKELDRGLAKCIIDEFEIPVTFEDDVVMFAGVKISDMGRLMAESRPIAKELMLNMGK